MKKQHPIADSRGAIVIVAVLVIVALLTLAGYQYSDLMLNEYRGADAAARAQQARAFADSGVYYAAALLSNPDLMSGTLGNNPYDNAAAFQNVVLNSNETNSRRQGSFTIFAPMESDSSAGTSSGVRYGVTDEASKINLNALLQLDSSGDIAVNVLLLLPNMTEEIADAIVDWIDTDDEQRTSGAESDYYSALSPGYLCKNGPLDSLEELLLVKGVTPELLFGNDRNRNGVEDDGENSGSGWSPGWSAFLTVYSRERNVDNAGAGRTFLNETDLKASYEALKTAVGEDLANYIVLYRTQKGTMTTSSGNRPASREQIQSKIDEVLQSSQPLLRPVSYRFDLVNSGVTWTVGQGRNQQTVQMTSPLNDAAQLRTLLPMLLDKTTTQQTQELPARINVMTAPLSVLATLPGLVDEDIQAVINARPAPGSDTSDPVYQTVAWLMTDAKLTADKMRALERYVTARTQVYRVQVLGQFNQAGPTARVEAVIDINDGRPRIVMYRDLTELGRGLNVTQ
jgi:type II secretory pathway component PulK